MRLADDIREDFETAVSFPNRIMLCTSFCRLCSSVLVLLPACLSVVSVHVRSLAFVRPCLPFSNVPLHSLHLFLPPVLTTTPTPTPSRWYTLPISVQVYPLQVPRSFSFIHVHFAPLRSAFSFNRRLDVGKILYVYMNTWRAASIYTWLARPIQW